MIQETSAEKGIVFRNEGGQHNKELIANKSWDLRT